MYCSVVTHSSNHHPLTLVFGLGAVAGLLQVFGPADAIFLKSSWFHPGAAHRRFDRKSGVDCPNAILV